jgi:threonine dehydrogenase-like Zn-dependent dehydrogenase
MPMAMMRNLTVRVTFASVPGTWHTLVPLLEQGRLRVDDLITHRLGLSDAVDAYRRFDARDDGILKVVLDPTR